MDQPQFPSLWGVKGLNEAEQRDVRGGALKSNRADCIRNAIRNYAQNRRSGGERSGLLSQLLSDIANANCGSGSGSGLA